MRARIWLVDGSAQGIAEGRCADIARSMFTARCELHQFIIGAIREQGFENGEIEAVTAAIGAIGAKNRMAGKGEIADRIKQFVANELVGKAQAFRIDDAIFRERDRVVERGAERKAGFPQMFDIAHEAKGAGAGNITAEGPGMGFMHPALPADCGIGEVDLDIEAQGRHAA